MTIHAMEYYVPIKCNNLLIHTALCMDLKGIVLSEKKNPITKGHILYDIISLEF